MSIAITIRPSIVVRHTAVVPIVNSDGIAGTGRRKVNRFRRGQTHFRRCDVLATPGPRDPVLVHS